MALIVELGDEDADLFGIILSHPKKLESPLLVKCCRLFVIFAGPSANFIMSQASKSIEGCLDEFCTNAFALGVGTNPHGNDLCLGELPFGIISSLECFGSLNRNQCLFEHRRPEELAYR